MLEYVEIQVQSLGQEDPPEKEMVTHSSILAWEIPWREEPALELFCEKVLFNCFFIEIVREWEPSILYRQHRSRKTIFEGEKFKVVSSWSQCSFSMK